MLLRHGFVFLVLCSLSCKAIQGKRTAHEHPAPSAGPMSCSVYGQIVDVLGTPDADTGSICHKYPCRARVSIIEVFACGSSVSLSLSAGDTLDMSFAYTMNNTSGIFPGMKVQYPGLKKGSKFVADAEQQLRVGSGGGFVIYGYRLK